MSKWRAIGAVAVTCLFLAGKAAQAQPYQTPYYPPPCTLPTQAFINAVTPEQRAQACAEQERTAASQNAYSYQQQQEQERQQRAAQTAQAAANAAEQDRLRIAEAAREAQERHAAALAALEQKRAEVQDAVQQVAAYNRLMDAEKAPDNQCRQPTAARILMESWSDLDTFKNNGMKAIDIEHLITLKFDAETSTMTCHGIFVVNHGQRMIGSLEIRKNVAGDTIYDWRADPSQDETPYMAPTPAVVALAVNGPASLSTPSPLSFSSPPALTPAVSSSQSLENGLTDRKIWEAWFASLSGETREGATWWVSHRSLPKHASCQEALPDPTAEWKAGCVDATQILTPFDRRRKADQLYRAGWNSF